MSLEYERINELTNLPVRIHTECLNRFDVVDLVYGVLEYLQKLNCEIYFLETNGKTTFDNSFPETVKKARDDFQKLDFYVFFSDIEERRVNPPESYDELENRICSMKESISYNPSLLAMKFYHQAIREKTGDFLLGIKLISPVPAAEKTTIPELKLPSPGIELFPIGTESEYLDLCKDEEYAAFVFTCVKKIRYEIKDEELFPCEKETFTLEVKESYWGKDLAHYYSKKKFLSVKREYFFDENYELYHLIRGGVKTCNTKDFIKEAVDRGLSFSDAYSLMCENNKNDALKKAAMKETFINALGNEDFFSDAFYEDEMIGDRFIDNPNIPIAEFQEIILNSIFSDSRFQVAVEMIGHCNQKNYSSSGETFFSVMGKIKLN